MSPVRHGSSGEVAEVKAQLWIGRFLDSQVSELSGVKFYSGR